MLKIGILGRDESLKGFQVLGAEVFCVESDDQAWSALLQMKDFGIVFLADSLQEPLSATLSAMAENGSPVFLFLPEEPNKESFGQRKLRQCVEKAVGADIIGE